ncbi:MAG: phage major capsid protein [Patescibacteria group bacterium]|jgi:HK97 family phage major capsid protein
MDQKALEAIKDQIVTSVDAVIEKRLGEAVTPLVAGEVRRIVDELRMEKTLFGKDRTGLGEEQKSLFVETVKAAAGFKTKANEALISEQDNRGGFLVSKEVESAILRIAASVGLVMAQAQQWTMNTDEKAIPNYTGSFLEGEFLGVDAAGSVTGITFGEANLIAKKWQLAFVVGNDLLADASPALADWLLALAGESLANMTDKQGLAGSGAPFVGVLNHTGATAYTMPTGETTFASFSAVVDASDVIANLDESVLDGAAFYMHRTVWAKIRSQKDGANAFILPQAGAVSNGVLANYAGNVGGPKPVGELLGYPVFTTRHLPANSATAVSTKYMIFGNLKALAYGERGGMTVSQHESGSFGGKEIALADQRALVYKKRLALVVALPAAFVVVKTAAS